MTIERKYDKSENCVMTRHDETHGVVQGADSLDGRPHLAAAPAFCFARKAGE